MNIFNAPLLLLLDTFSAGDNDAVAPSEGATPRAPVEGQLRGAKRFILVTSSLLTVGVLLLGVYKSVWGGSAATEFSIGDTKLKTDSMGLALIVFALIFYYLTSREILKYDRSV